MVDNALIDDPIVMHTQDTLTRLNRLEKSILIKRTSHWEEYIFRWPGRLRGGMGLGTVKIILYRYEIFKG